MQAKKAHTKNLYLIALGEKDHLPGNLYRTLRQLEDHLRRLALRRSPRRTGHQRDPCRTLRRLRIRPRLHLRYRHRPPRSLFGELEAFFDSASGLIDFTDFAILFLG